MEPGLKHLGSLTLQRGELLKLEDATGRHLTVLRGTVWITQRGEQRDAVLDDGATFRFERQGLSIVQPLGGPAELLLEAGLAPESQTHAGANSVEAQARALAASGDFQREARRLRAETTAAMVAKAGAILTAGARSGWRWLQGIARAPAPSAALSWLSDHQLRDLGLRRDQVRFASLTRVCAYC